MTTQKTTFENKPSSALFINGPYESRNVGIKLYFRDQLYFCLYHMVSPSSNNKTSNARLLARHKFVTGATLLQLVY